MIKRRLIPKLQLKRSQFGSKSRMILVSTVNFEQVIEVGDPVSQARIFQDQAADELIFLDLEASHTQRAPLLELIKQVAEEVFMPLTIGGGVSSIQDFRLLLSHGADKVSINTAALDDPELIRQAAAMFGAQCVVVSIDYRRVAGAYRVATRGGKHLTDWHPVDWAQECERLGAGEILLTSIDRDGLRQGLDLELTEHIARRVSIPVITAGGCGTAAHFVAGFQQGKADAVASGTFFFFQDQSLMETRAHIKNAGIPIRIHT